MAPDVTITLKTIDQSSAVVKKVNQEFKSLSPGLEKATGSMGKFVSANAGLLSVMGGVAAGALAVGKAIYASAKAWEEGAKIGAKLEAILKSTGGAAGQTVDGLNKMADSLARVNGLDDELVKNGEALLLTFTKIKGEGFEPTMQAAIDMAAVLGGDLNGAVIQVGKAMNDFSGYTALKRAGVSFTEEQIKQIEHFKETNDLVGYQNLLLNELQTEFGGAAKAMTEAGLGGEAVALAFGNLNEEIGRAASEGIQDFNRGLAYTLEGITKVVEKANDLDDLAAQFDALGLSTKEVSGNMGRGLNPEFERFVKQMEKGAAMTEFYKNKYPELTSNIEDTTAAEEELEASSQKYMSVLKNISGETESFTEKNQELSDKLTELEEKLAKERKGSGAYKEIQGEIEATKAAVTELADEHAQASKSMMFDLISQQAAAEGFKNISVEALAALGEQWGVLAQGSGEATSTMISQAEAWTQALEQPGGKLQGIIEMWDNLRELSKKGITLTATVVQQATGGAMGGQNTMTQCFTGDTLVSMADGSSVAIKDIRVGDVVLSHDTNSGQNIKTVVIETFQHPASDGGRLLLINGYLKVTPEHLLWNGHTWQPAGEFAPGDVLINLDGSHMRVASVREIVKNEPVYNIHVDNEVHNYYAGGVLVHNAKQNDVVTQWAGGIVGSFAKGGKAGGWGLVGDRQGGGFIPGVSELIFGNARVFNSRESEKMLKSGMFGRVPGFALGGQLTRGAKKPQGGSTTSGGSGGSSGGSLSSIPLDEPTTSIEINTILDRIATETTTEVRQLASQVEIAITSMTAQIQAANASNQQMQNSLDRVVSVLLSENPRAVGKQVAFEVSRMS